MIFELLWTQWSAQHLLSHVTVKNTHCTWRTTRCITHMSHTYKHSRVSYESSLRGQFQYEMNNVSGSRILLEKKKWSSCRVHNQDEHGNQTKWNIVSATQCSCPNHSLFTSSLALLTLPWRNSLSSCLPRRPHILFFIFPILVFLLTTFHLLMYKLALQT